MWRSTLPWIGVWMRGEVLTTKKIYAICPQANKKRPDEAAFSRVKAGYFKAFTTASPISRVLTWVVPGL
ncbi:MAG: hypothetical protein RLY90_931 [Pseudomonadota bacterium]|jgi:hypothetical protein